MFADQIDAGKPSEPQPTGQSVDNLPAEDGQTGGSPEWKAAVEALRDEFKQEQERTFQRLRDSLGDRDRALRDEIAKERSKLERIKTAAGLSDDWLNAQLETKSAAIASRYMEQGDEPAQAQPVAPAQPPAITPQQVESLNVEVAKITAATGVVLMDNDPEMQELVRLEKTKSMTMEEFLGEYRKRVDQKAIRTNKVIQPRNDAQPGARIPGPAQGATTGDLMTQYQSEAAGLRPGSEDIFQLRRKYRRLGLDI